VVRLATWNVNSIRSRADRVVAWLQRRDVDVLALQETKCRDDQFPEGRFTEKRDAGAERWTEEGSVMKALRKTWASLKCIMVMPSQISISIFRISKRSSWIVSRRMFQTAAILQACSS